MIAEEQREILAMVETGRINAWEALKLINALDEASSETENLPVEAIPKSKYVEPDEFAEIAGKARRMRLIPLWIGVLISVLSSYWLYLLISTGASGLLLICATIFFLSSILLMGIFGGYRNSYWLYLRVDQPNREWPEKIILILPLPIGLAAWILNYFGLKFNGLDKNSLDQIVKILSTELSSTKPLIVNVNEAVPSERVQIYIG